MKRISTDQYDLSVIIVSYNTCSILIRCIQSIYEFSENLRIKIIVSDNASSDDTVRTIRNKFPQVQILENKKNLGFSAANNRAIHLCRGRFVLFLNPDVILIRPVLTRAIKFMEENHDAGLVGCKLINPDGNIQKSFHASFPTLTNRFLEAIYIEKLLDKKSGYDKKGNAIRKVASITGAFILVRRNLIKALGGFDESFFMYCEDIDLSFRVRQMGYDIYYLRDIAVLHYLGTSTKTNKKAYFTKVLTKESVYRYFMKHHGRAKATLYRILMIIGAITRIIILLILAPVRKNLKTYFDINYYNSLLKYTKVVSWGLGFEKWTKIQGKQSHS